MPATIHNLMTPWNDNIYFNEDFLIALKSYIPYLKRSTAITYETPTNNILYKYQGDFYGLLDYMGYSKQYFFCILLFNGLRSSTDFKSDMTTVAIPDLNEIDLLYSTFAAYTNTAL